MLGSCLDGRVTGYSGDKWLKIRSYYGHRGRAAPVYSVVLWVVWLDDGWGYGHVFRTGDIFWLGIRTCFSKGVYIPVGDTDVFSPPMGGACGAYAIRPYTCYMPYMKIRPCFSNRVYVSVRGTVMFSPPTGGVCGAYAVAPLHVLHAVH